MNLQTSPLTARTLETLIRLSTAHAKARLSAKVDESDAMAAEEILRFALFKEVVKVSKSKNKKRKLNNSSAATNESDESEESEEEDDETAEQRAAEKAKRMDMPSSQASRRNPRRAKAADDSGVGVTSTPGPEAESSQAEAPTPTSQRQFMLTEDDVMDEDDDFEAEQALLSQEQRDRAAPTSAPAVQSSPARGDGPDPAR